ncbi:unnamed protein product [Rotaria sp. Silwood1]|nr:unnamed protein product [Rotaria sp. Silwood1]
MSHNHHTTESKILTLEQVIQLAEELHFKEQSIVFTNGCFDLIHLGHIDYLEKAHQLGDKLIVGLNTDESIHKIKGPGRPIVKEYARARLIAALQFVDVVTLFNELTPLALIEAVRPNVLVKGGDYTIDTIVGADIVLHNGGSVKNIPLIEGYSTTHLIEMIQTNVNHDQQYVDLNKINVIQIKRMEHTLVETIKRTDRRGLIASGSILVDYIIIIDHWPMENCTSFVQRPPTIVGGGGPFNIVKNLVAMKAYFPLSLLGLIGNDDNGKWLIEDCIKSHIDTSQLEIINDSTPTSCTYVMSVENSDRRTFFHQQGANACLNEQHFDFSRTTAKLFYLGPLTQLARLDQFIDDNTRTNASKVLEAAHLSGLETIVDFSSGKNLNYSKIAQASLPFIDHLIINETEAGLIFDQHLTSDNIDQIQQTAKQLIDIGVRKTVTIHFEQGAILITKDGNILKQGSIILPAEFIKGAVGAGDAFAAGMIYGIHEQWPLDKTLRLAVCIGGMSLSDETSCGGMKTIDECLQLEKFGFRKL